MAVKHTNLHKNSNSGLKAVLLIIENIPYWQKAIKTVLGSDHWKILKASSAQEAMKILSSTEPDAILINHVSLKTLGNEFCRAIQAGAAYGHIPAAVITLEQNRAIQTYATRAGLECIVTNPIDVGRLSCKMRGLVIQGRLKKMLRRHATEIRSDWHDVVNDLQSIVNRLHDCPRRHVLKIMRQAGFADAQYKKHLTQLNELCATISKRLQMPPKNVRDVGRASGLKDVGNAVIPKPIFCKIGGLDEMEKKIIEQHTYIGNYILHNAQSEAIQIAARIALHHHERWDGQGYPYGLQNESIPIEARITAVADVFLALCETRPYRPAFKRYEAFQFIQRGSGKQFDPKVVKAFEKSVI